MNHIKRIRIGVVLLALALSMGCASQAPKQDAQTQSSPEGKPDAILRLSGGSFAAGIGFSWGGGTLTFKGKDYPVSVNGLSLGKVGISGASATGQVFGLTDIKDFPGRYNAAAAGLTVAGGRSGVLLRNQNGVRVRLVSTTRGFDVTVGGGGVRMSLRN